PALVLPEMLNFMSVQPIAFLSFFFLAEDGIRDLTVTGVQTCALPIWRLRQAPVGAITGLARGVDAELSHLAALAERIRAAGGGQIGRASCRERVWVSGAVVRTKKKCAYAWSKNSVLTCGLLCGSLTFL